MNCSQFISIKGDVTLLDKNQSLLYILGNLVGGSNYGDYGLEINTSFVRVSTQNGENIFTNSISESSLPDEQ